MTFSRRQFLEIDFILNNEYRLLKFFDTRDPRHTSFVVSHERELNEDWNKVVVTETATHDSQEEDEWCWTSDAFSVVVLYVPGHFGSYQQSRSLGAHGIQLTGGRSSPHQRKVLQKLQLQQQRQMHVSESDVVDDDRNSSLSSFLFDVYALNFRQEEGAFHGSMLQRQADFIGHAVNALYSKGQTFVIVVAHSIGGISTLLAVEKVQDETTTQEASNTIAAIVTLGSPLAFPVLTWSPSTYQLLYQIQQRQQTPPLISISGGLRDEIIPPLACNTNPPNKYSPDNNKNSNSLSLLATDIMKEKEETNHDSTATATATTADGTVSSTTLASVFFPIPK